MSRRTQKNVGVIGLGIIGQRVANCLRHRGFSTFVWNRHPRPFPNFVGSPAEIAELADFIQIFVSDDDALLDVIQQMKRTLSAHSIVMAHSTVAPHTMRAAAEMVNRRGAQLLDAPFTGSKLAAEKGELVYYIGGDDAAYRRARPVLEASSKEIIEIGDIGQATTIKLATNMITAATVQVAAEALALVHNAGLPLEKFAEAMRGNGSNSGTLTMKLPKMIEGDFDPHFSVKHMLKDVEIATRLARSYGLVLSETEVARDTLRKEAAEGRGDSDYSSVIHSFFPKGPPSMAAAAAWAEEQRDLELLERSEEESKRGEFQEDRVEEEIPAPEIIVERVEESVLIETVEASDTAEPSEPVGADEVEEAPAKSESGEEVRDEPTREEERPAEEPEATMELAEATKGANGHETGEDAPRRGFLSRIFNKLDY